MGFETIPVCPAWERRTVIRPTAEAQPHIGLAISSTPNQSEQIKGLHNSYRGGGGHLFWFLETAKKEFVPSGGEAMTLNTCW